MTDQMETPARPVEAPPVRPQAWASEKLAWLRVLSSSPVTFIRRDTYDSKYAEVDCLGRPDPSMLIDIDDDAMKSQPMTDRPELSTYPTEYQDADRTPRNEGKRCIQA